MTGTWKIQAQPAMRHLGSTRNGESAWRTRGRWNVKKKQEATQRAPNSQRRNNLSKTTKNAVLDRRPKCEINAPGPTNGEITK